MNSSLPFSQSEATSLLKALEREWNLRQSFQRLTSYVPYPKQREFHAAGATHRERMLMAGNQLGKTLSAAFETAMHLTGKYPHWWVGKRFNEPVRWLAGSESAELTRKGIQRLLLGPPENEAQWGTGAIPKADVVDWARRQGVPDAVATINVQNIHGGISSVQLATYDQGRTKWQADTVHGVWFDEEPPEDIYFEGITRTNTTLGPVITTLTPLMGVSNVVKRFYLDKPAGTHLTIMDIEDAEHYTPEQRAQIIASYPLHERKARTKGIPQLGSGRVFPIDDDEIRCEAFAIPSHWPQIGGLDFGWDHPSAAVKIAWDRDIDCLYVTAAHRQREQTPAMFAASVKPWGATNAITQWLPWAWPHDGLQHDKGSGEQLAKQYRDQGLSMLPLRATFEDGTNGVEAGVNDMLDRMQTGRWKVFAHLLPWFEEFNLYHRKDGLIVKKGDDLISASRYAMMMRRHAIVQNKVVKPAMNGMAPRPQGWMG